jgi:CrcB protein
VLLVIGLGGALGSLARYGVGRLLPWREDGFPWATFVENVSGGFALGVLLVFLLDVWPPHRYARPFLGVGLLGGYTTFSTYMLETRDLFAGDQAGTAVAYLFGSLVVGLAAVWLGIGSARLTVRRARHRSRDESDGSTERNTDDETRISS